MATKWCEYCEYTVAVGWHGTRCVGPTKPIGNTKTFKFMMSLIRTQECLQRELSSAKKKITQLEEEIKRMKEITLADKITEAKYANKPCVRFTPY
jgi:hypothetical protein